MTSQLLTYPKRITGTLMMPSLKWQHYVAYALAGLVLFTMMITPVLANDRPQSFADLAEELTPSVVNISTSTLVNRDGDDSLQFPPGSPFEDFFEEFQDRDNPRTAQALGSGFIVSAEGYVVTNNHVIDGADAIRVTLYNDRSFDAELIGRDPKTDIAVLKIDPEDEILQPVAFGDSDQMRVGDWVLAIGNPFGLGGSVTAGIISARGRDIGTGPYDDFIQTDAAINRGNSGGPLFNLDGEVIGINTAIFSQSGGSVGIGFAIAANLASNVVDQLTQFGQTRRGWLGVFIQEITPEIAENFGLEDESGALISSVHKEGPAEIAGIKAGDVVIAFNGKPIEEMRSLPRIVAESPIGKPIDMVVMRDGKKITLSVTLGVLEEAEEAGLLASTPTEQDTTTELNNDKLGFVLETLTPERREDFSVGDDINGVVIMDIVSGSPADDAGLMVGDIIRRVGKSSVDTLDKADAAIRREMENGKTSIVLLINRGGRDRFMAITVE
ncbi:MAG: DegQ family serine endoprotease [Candidatus Puniceispirillales bacterium]